MTTAVQYMPWTLDRHQSLHSSQSQPMISASNRSPYILSYAQPPASPASGLPSMYYYNHQPQSHGLRWTSPIVASSYATTVDPVVLQMSQQAHQPTSPSGPFVNANWQDHGMAWPPSSPHASHQLPPQQSVPISPQHGPPRRPIQSKHALWVGNIPGHAHIIALRDHFFTPETAGEILSVVFTPSSNSGFVNFRTEEACKASMRRFNKSFLYGVPLNCRARKPTFNGPSTAHKSGVQTSESSKSSPMLDSPISRTSSLASHLETPQKQAGSDSNADDKAHGHDARANVDGEPNGDVVDGLKSLDLESGHPQNRYFIIKSLTLDDLVNSVKSRRWSTQMHNEQALDEAFKNGDYVYLIFSVNRSREYFGYARMTTATNYDPAPVVTSTPPRHTVQQSAMAAKPPIIRTSPIGHIPAGRIVDELCRGKIFWEIEGIEQAPAESDGIASPGVYGSQKSFGIEWLSLKRIPFRHTTHLRNSMNENKEVKIARDGTELDPDVGRRLCTLFHMPT